MARLANARTNHMTRWVIPVAKRLLIEEACKHALTLPLEEVAHIEMGQSPDGSSCNDDGDGVPLIGGPSDLGLEFPQPTRWTNSPTKLSRPGDIIVCVRATIGEPRWADGIYCLGRGVAGIRPIDKNLLPKFLFFIIEGNEQILRNQGTGTTFKAISKEHLASIRVPIIPVEEQEIIVSFLVWLEQNSNTRPNFLDAPPLPKALTNQRRIVVRIEELAAKIEETRGLRREAMEEADTLVNAYARKLLATTSFELTELRYWLNENRDGIQTGPFGAQLGKQDFESTGVPVLSIGNIQYYGLELNDLKYVSEEKAQQLSRFSIKEGDILFARMGTVGRCCVVPQKAEGWLFNYHIIRVALDKSRVDPRYIHWSIRASKDIEQYLGQKIRGATREGVNSSIVGSLPVRVPSLHEQHQIVTYLDDLQTEVEALRQFQSETSAELDALLPSVLNKAFKGEL